MGETWDGFLNDIAAMVVTPADAVRGIEQARSERVREGNEGGGTGMCCLGWKGGTGSSSRVVKGVVRKEGGGEEETEFVVGALAQCNFGQGYDLRIGGVPVGRLLMAEEAVKFAERNLAPKADANAQPEPDPEAGAANAAPSASPASAAGAPTPPATSSSPFPPHTRSRVRRSRAGRSRWGRAWMWCRT